jgi:hypothetical protein
MLTHKARCGIAVQNDLRSIFSHAIRSPDGPKRSVLIA